MLKLTITRQSPSHSFGFTLGERTVPDGQPHVITSVGVGGPADGVLLAGDVVLTVGEPHGTLTASMSHPELKAAVADAGLTLALMVKRVPNVAYVMAYDTELSGPDPTRTTLYSDSF
jgi:hypothetical protein